MTIQSTDTTSEINLNNNYDILIVDAGVNVAVTASHAVYTYGIGDVIDNAGRLVCSQLNAIEVTADASSVVNESTGIIMGYCGIQMDAASGSNMTVQNSGTIIGINDAGVYSYENVSIVNHGTISGEDHGVVTADLSTIENDGTIQGPVAISTGTLRLVNHGMIEGNIVTADSGNSQVTNTGLIVGDVTFAGGTNKFDDRHGSVDGTIAGGTGAIRSTRAAKATRSPPARAMTSSTPARVRTPSS